MSDEVDFGDLPLEEPDFGDAPPWPRTFASEADFVEAAREILVCASCERSVHGDDGEPCAQQGFVRGCTSWTRRVTP